MAQERLSPTRLVDRRRFLAGSALTAAAAVAWRPALGGAQATAGAAISAYPFTLGVGSGDPLPDAVVLWTRLAPDPLNGGGMPPGDVAVDWEVAADEAFTTIVTSGTAIAPEAYAHSVHVDVTGLEPATTYWYRFTTGGSGGGAVGTFDSPVGRTRTAPANGSSPDRLRFGFASCQNYSSGFYTAHANLAAEDLDVCFHLGDYIYEGAGTGVRSVPGGEATTLAGYRNRYALYRADENLQAVHHRFPWVVTWDDHEVDNNYANDIAEDGTTGAAFLTRRAEAYQAWWEHQAVRMPAPVGADLQIYRWFRWGDLASFYILDTRQYRSNQACGDGIGPLCDEGLIPERTMLGTAQENWLDGATAASGATWNVIAQQVVMAYTPLLGAVNRDQWDGYPDARRRLFEVLGRPEVTNPLVLTGDIHASGAGKLLADWDNPDRSPVVGHELIGTSISSIFPAGLAGAFTDLAGSLPWAAYANALQRGYVTVELTPTQAEANWRVVDTVAQPTSGARTDFTWVIPAGDPDGAELPTSPVVVDSEPVAAAPRFTG